MAFTKEQKRIAYQKLSPEMQSFVMDQEMMEVITTILENENFTDDQVDLADSEILYTMYELQSLADAIVNIGKITGKSVGDLNRLRTNLENLVFAKAPERKTEVKVDAGKINEIAHKYSLNTIQEEQLLTISKTRKSEDGEAELIQSIASDLGISKMLAEQLAEEIQTRVVRPPREKGIESTMPRVETSRTLEIKPDNLPMVEIGNSFVASKASEKPLASVPQYATTPAAMRAPEMSQKPYGVPRFGTASVPPKVQTLNLNQTKPETSQGFMENKLNNVTINMGNNFMEKAEPAITPASPIIEKKDIPRAPGKYSTDPYREPLN